MTKNKPAVFTPLSPKRNSEEIARQIEESIIAKLFKPNDRLPSERELAVQFSTGRNAVREALRILEGNGFIVVKPGGDGGIFVKELDFRRMTKVLIDLFRMGQIEIKDITEMRIMIETKIVEACIDSIKEEDLARLEENLDQCEKLVKRNESTLGTIQNFHRLLASFSMNQLLIYFLDAIVEISDSYVENKLPGLPLSPKHLKHHRNILNALKKRDVEAAKLSIVDHLQSVDKHLENYHKNRDKSTT